MDYKFEHTPNIWIVHLERGAYSSREEENYFIAANSADEAWHFVTKLWEDQHSKSKHPHHMFAAVDWKGMQFRLKEESYAHNVWSCDIEMLEVLYVAKLD